MTRIGINYRESFDASLALLGSSFQEKIKQITTKKENAIKGLSDKTLNELKRMGFSEIDIDGAKKRVWKNSGNIN